MTGDLERVEKSMDSFDDDAGLEKQMEEAHVFTLGQEDAARRCLGIVIVHRQVAEFQTKKPDVVEGIHSQCRLIEMAIRREFGLED